MRNQAVTKKKRTKAPPYYRGGAVIYGEKFEVGYTLRVKTGAWNGYPLPSVKITWVVNGEDIGFKHQYRIQEGDKEIYVRLIGINSEGIGEGTTPVYEVQ